MSRLALRIAYNGSAYYGSQLQEDVPTVEGALIGALKTVRAIKNADENMVRFASRTDRGVNAIGNCVALDTELDHAWLAEKLNIMVRDIWVTGWADVPAEFNPRHANFRRYTYAAVDSGWDRKAYLEALSCFIGEHDFASFCKRDGRSTVVRLDEAAARFEGGIVHLEFRAPYFLWHQVLRIARACDRAGSGETRVEDIRAALEGALKLDIGAAHPGGLTLTEVNYDFKFNPINIRGRNLVVTRRRLAKRIGDAQLFAHLSDAAR